MRGRGGFHPTFAGFIQATEVSSLIVVSESGCINPSWNSIHQYPAAIPFFLESLAAAVYSVCIHS